MLARGYTGQLRTLYPHVMKSSDWQFAAFSVVMILLLQLTGRF
jgi:energy-coupling factor transporter transmembrane protein EcfT